MSVTRPLISRIHTTGLSASRLGKVHSEGNGFIPRICLICLELPWSLSCRARDNSSYKHPVLIVELRCAEGIREHDDGGEFLWQGAGIFSADDMAVLGTEDVAFLQIAEVAPSGGAGSRSVVD